MVTELTAAGYDYTDILLAVQQAPECRQTSDKVDIGSEIWANFPEYMEPNRLLQLYVPPILLILGTFGNVLSFVIMSRNMFKVSTYCYLALLAIMDTFVLYIGLLRMWISNFALDIQIISNCMCKLVTFFGYVSSVTSVWLIIAVTIERFIAVKFPLKAPRICNVVRARIVILTITLATCLLNSHIFWTVELRSNDINGTVSSKCDASVKHVILIKEIWPWVDAAVYSFVPFVIISVLNSMIVRRVLEARRQRNELQMMPLTNKYLSARSRCTVKRSNESSKKLTCMLLAVSFTFLITTLPMNILMLVNALLGDDKTSVHSYEYKRKYAILTLARTVVEMLMYINHSMNFFLYCATGRKFRQQVKLLLCLCCNGRIKDFFTHAARQNTSTQSSKMSRLGSDTVNKETVIECDRAKVRSKLTCESPYSKRRTSNV
ncbi:growth hormone secretagogue receptor type 1-like [Dreissena polymorpha]|nr:growth hormone secretagogue receptor type 1-like [Dreissena polymorpha]